MMHEVTRSTNIIEVTISMCIDVNVDVKGRERTNPKSSTGNYMHELHKNAIQKKNEHTQGTRSQKFDNAF